MPAFASNLAYFYRCVLKKQLGITQKISLLTMSVQKDILLGSQPGQLNLQAVKARASEIIHTMNQLLQVLQFAPSSLQWYEYLYLYL